MKSRSSVLRGLWWGAAATVLAVMCLAPSGAGADTATVGVAPDKVSAHVTGAMSRSATIHLVVSNNQASAAAVTFAATLDDGSPAIVSPLTADVAPYSSKTVTLELSGYGFRQVAGQVEATVSGGATVVVPLAITRTPSATDVWLPILVAAVLAALAAIVIAIRTSGAALGRTQIGGAPKWSFQDSWAQNISGLGAVLATVLGASGFISSELAGLDTAKFVGLSLFAGALVLVAPLFMFGKPTALGFLLASGTTLLATFLEFGTLVELLHYAHAGTAEGWFIGALLIAATCLLFVYGVVTARRTIDGTRRHHVATSRFRVPVGAEAPQAEELQIPMI